MNYSGMLSFVHELIDKQPFGTHHSVCLVADFNGDGHQDIFVGEMGLGRNPHSRLLIYLNDGRGSFSANLIDDEHPTHEAKLVDLENTGVVDIVGKPYHPPARVDLRRNVRCRRIR